MRSDVSSSLAFPNLLSGILGSRARTHQSVSAASLSMPARALGRLPPGWGGAKEGYVGPRTPQSLATRPSSFGTPDPYQPPSPDRYDANPPSFAPPRDERLESTPARKGMIMKLVPALDFSLLRGGHRKPAAPVALAALKSMPSKTSTPQPLKSSEPWPTSFGGIGSSSQPAAPPPQAPVLQTPQHGGAAPTALAAALQLSQQKQAAAAESPSKALPADEATSEEEDDDDHAEEADSEPEESSADEEDALLDHPPPSKVAAIAAKKSRIAALPKRPPQATAMPPLQLEQPPAAFVAASHASSAAGASAGAPPSAKSASAQAMLAQLDAMVQPSAAMPSSSAAMPSSAAASPSPYAATSAGAAGLRAHAPPSAQPAQAASGRRLPKRPPTSNLPGGGGLDFLSRLEAVELKEKDELASAGRSVTPLKKASPAQVHAEPLRDVLENGVLSSSDIETSECGASDAPSAAASSTVSEEYTGKAPGRARKQSESKGAASPQPRAKRAQQQTGSGDTPAKASAAYPTSSPLLRHESPGQGLSKAQSIAQRRLERSANKASPARHASPLRRPGPLGSPSVRTASPAPGQGRAGSPTPNAKGKQRPAGAGPPSRQLNAPPIAPPALAVGNRFRGP